MQSFLSQAFYSCHLRQRWKPLLHLLMHQVFVIIFKRINHRLNDIDYIFNCLLICFISSLIKVFSAPVGKYLVVTIMPIKFQIKYRLIVIKRVPFNFRYASHSFTLPGYRTLLSACPSNALCLYSALFLPDRLSFQNLYKDKLVILPRNPIISLTLNCYFIILNNIDAKQTCLKLIVWSHAMVENGYRPCLCTVQLLEMFSATSN